VGDLVPLIAAIVTSVGTIGAAALGARRLAGRASDGHRNAARWREQAELEKARADYLGEQLDEERDARSALQTTLAAERTLHAADLGKLATTQHDLDDCARQRDNAYSELRQVQHRRVPRPTRPGG
jgi:hypothetical protein